MRIALFGATGMIGRRVLGEAVRRGHGVTAIARDPSKVEGAGPGVQAVKGDVLDATGVAYVVSGHDAVVSAFSPLAGGGAQGVDSLVASVRSLMAGLTQAAVRRLVVVGGAGSLEVAPGVLLVDTPEFPAAWKGVALAHGEALDVLRREGFGLDWTYFSPAAIIEPGARTGKFRLREEKLVVDEKGESRISAEDYAVALVDELEKPRYVGRRFTVGY